MTCTPLRRHPADHPGGRPSRPGERAGVRGGRRWTGASSTGTAPSSAARPLDVVRDVARWWQAASVRSEPTWASPNRIELESELVRLRAFGPEEPDPVVPTLLFRPRRGTARASSTTAPSRARSRPPRGRPHAPLLAGLDRRDGDAPRRRRRLPPLRRAAIEHIGGPVNLIGDCQGGWLATIYAALRPGAVHTLTIAGAPIDFHGGEGVIHDYVEFLGPGDIRFYAGGRRGWAAACSRASSCSTASSPSSRRTRSPSTSSC